MNNCIWPNLELVNNQVFYFVISEEDGGDDDDDDDHNNNLVLKIYWGFKFPNHDSFLWMLNNLS